MRRLLAIIALWSTTTAFASSAAALRPIKRSDLRPVVKATSIATLRKMDSSLSKKAFNAKLKSALKSSQRLKQTYPGLLGVLLKPLVGTRALPGRTVALGFDDHLANTGTVRIGDESKGRSRSIQTVIDVDDGGMGPAGVEAVSIGAGLKQAGAKRRVLNKAIKAFAKAATGDERGPLEVKGPKWRKLREDWLANNTKLEDRDGKQLLSLKNETRVSKVEYAGVVKAARTHAVLKGYEVLDVAREAKDDGGAAGLAEMLVLARERSSDEVRLFLLKQATTAGAAQLGVAQPKGASRLVKLQKGLWKDVPQDVFFYLNDLPVPGRGKIDFLVRDKLAIVSNSAKLGKDGARAIDVASLYGREHAGQFGDLTAPQLAKWTKKSTRAVSEAFDELVEQLREEREQR